MTTFYHPYQFIPATGKINSKTSAQTSYRTIKEGLSPVRHDLWLSESVSGEVVCRLSTVSPLFVGAQNENEASDSVAKSVPHFSLPINDTEYPAIPANSLRGMVSQCIETLSQSTLRVLEDKTLSVRKQMPKEGAGQENNDLLYGLGIIKPMQASDEECIGYGILPLVTSTQLEIGDGKGGHLGVNCDKKLPWMKLFHGRKLCDCLPAYIDGYNDNNGKTDQLYRYNPQAYPYPNSNTFYYAKLNDCLKHVKVGDSFTWSAEMNKSVVDIDGRLLAQEHNGFLSAEEYQLLPIEEKRLYTRGIMRVLDMDKYKKIVPFSKNKELFIPYPEDVEAELTLLPISKSVFETFSALVTESKLRGKDQDLPVRLKGYEDAEIAENRLFYFGCESQVLKPDPVETPLAEEVPPARDLLSMIRASAKRLEEAEKDEPEEEFIYTVNEISLTSLWRKRIPESLYAFFNNDQESAHLTPWRDEEQQTRSRDLTPAETLLGFVSDGTLESTKIASALASRIRFSDGSLVQPEHDPDYYMTENEVVLKILDSPKLPSPTMYFSDLDDSGDFISKTGLNPRQHKANGFKYYLHHPKACHSGSTYTPWKTENVSDRPKQKVNIRPVRKGIDFSFTISFDNISHAEFELLLTGLSPGEGCLHHLGMGKPLGLGSVKLDVAGVYFIDRLSRYNADGLFASRFHKAWLNLQDDVSIERINSDFKRHSAEVIPIQEALEVLNSADHEKLIDRASHELLCTLMKADSIPHDAAIHYPLIEDQKEENKGFLWFVQNDKAPDSDKQMLGTVNRGTIPMLKMHPNKRNR